MDAEIYLMGSERTVGGELQHRFLEIEIPSVAQRSRYTFAFFVQCLGGELLSLLYLAPFVLSDAPHRLLRQIDRIMADRIGFVGCDKIGEIDLAVLNHFLRVHLGMEIAHVVHLLAQLLHADGGQFLVVDDGCFAHLVGIPCQPFVRFRRRVRRSGVIDMELQLPETEDLGVLLLPQITAQLSGGDGFIVHTFHLCLVQQIVPFRHELSRVTRGQH